MKLNQIIHTVQNGQDMTAAEAQTVFDMIFNGDVKQETIADLLMALHNKGETVSEIQGAVLSMRSHMKTIEAPDSAIDIVGTGGDGHGTLNISTAAAIVTAGAGVPVAKHGNRSATSQSGSSDVLSALGVNLNASLDVVQRALQENGLAFLFAPNYHPAMKHVAEVRRNLGIRTIFNLLGPLTNPAHVTLHVIGVYDNVWSRPMAETLKTLGSRAAWITYGPQGLDEISTTGSSHICELKNNIIQNFDISPQEAGFKLATLDDIKGGDAKTNAEAIVELLDGKKSPYRDIVLMNAGAALYIAGKTNNYASSVKLAALAIDNGAAKEKLNQLITITNA